MTSLTKASWKSYISLIAGPLLFGIIVLFKLVSADAHIRNTVAVAGWILIWWVTEAVPIPVTALLPLVLFPIMRVLDLNATAVNYANPTIFLYMAGFIFALAMEKHKLHIRIALYIVRFVGTKSNRIVLGFMIATAFISMWVNNTATTLMMLPIATSVLTLMEDEFLSAGLESDYKNFAKSVLLSVAYCASIGGMATIIGTPTNAVLITFFKQFYQIDISFAGWFLVGFPVSVVMLIAAYFIIVKLLFKVKTQSLPGTQNMLDAKINELGKMSFQEYAISTVFIITALGWVLRTPFIEWFGLNFLNDTIIGLSGALLLFMIPDPASDTRFLFDWGSMKKLSWGILFLIGGGLALAKALENSGIIKLVGHAITANGISGTFILVAILIVVTLLLKQFIGNTALATIMLPMAFGVANATGINPILLGAPVTLACSCAYMLPMSTPPNAIVFTTGNVSIKDMMRSGFLLVIVSFLVLLAAYGLYSQMLYGSLKVSGK
ncbi:DASS family sodium-coupled anion symporter [Mucilaginibacter sp. dw_454]|uniref:SLC13 family permease n=1 Tax=Mucilaginibacter sp. dw_454 TaxID=2720079 RepID=UPI001BD1E0A6|nr:DASS family sodium-coupled anion symporter [Mucilaginibacter sp. dw_454]